MIQSLKKLPKIYWVVVLFILLLPCVTLFLTLSVQDEHARMVISDISSPLYNLLATIALLIATVQTRKISKRHAWGWGILALAQFSFLLGDCIWAVIELGYKTYPFPSIADGAYLLFYPLFFLGILRFPSKRFNPLEWVKRAIDISIIMIAAILGYWIFLIGPILQAQIYAQSLETILTIAYPVGDLILLFALLLIIYYRTEKTFTRPIWLLISGMIVMIIGDSIYCYQSSSGIYASGGILDFVWIICYLLIGLAGLYQAVTAKAYHENDIVSYQNLLTQERIFRAFSYIPYICVVLTYALLFWFFHDTGLLIDFDTLFFSVGLIIALVLIRQMLVLNENNHLLTTLRRALEQVKFQASELDHSNTNLRQEISERSRVEAQLAHDALHDGLTGLANRVLLIDRLEHAIEFNKRDLEFCYSVLFLDLDNFKAINDRHGHLTGDKVLAEVGLRLRKCTRSIDTVARFGGDEFVILLENSTENNAAMVVANRVLSELSHPIHLRSTDLQLTCSVGVIQGITEYTNPEEILRDVDIAMYHAKENGKSRSEMFSLEMRNSALDLLETESDLWRALADHEFVLFYQPIFSLEENQIAGLEALVRWRHPFRGLRMPSEFIIVAEKSGLIIPLGDWVLSEACYQMRKWQSEYPYLSDLRINVNISGKQIIQKGFVEKVKETLRSNNLDPKKLNLEITENAFIENQAVLNHLFNELRKVGVGFSIDDFGTGYSSLGYLKNMPVNTIKIDKSFIDDILAGEKDFEIIKTIIQMAHSLGMDTVAEGIEDEEQLLILRSLKCKYGQGFFLSRPLDSVAAEKILKMSFDKTNYLGEFAAIV